MRPVPWEHCYSQFPVIEKLGQELKSPKEAENKSESSTNNSRREKTVSQRSDQEHYPLLRIVR